jgi:hypothetical protein
MPSSERFRIDSLATEVFRVYFSPQDFLTKIMNARVFSTIFDSVGHLSRQRALVCLKRRISRNSHSHYYDVSEGSWQIRHNFSEGRI